MSRLAIDGYWGRKPAQPNPRGQYPERDCDPAGVAATSLNASCAGCHLCPRLHGASLRYAELPAFALMGEQVARDIAIEHARSRGPATTKRIRFMTFASLR